MSLVGRVYADQTGLFKRHLTLRFSQRLGVCLLSGFPDRMENFLEYVKNHEELQIH